MQSTFRKYLIALSLGVCVVAILSGCDTIISQFDSQQEPVRNNEQDPESQSPSTPSAVITSPDTELSSVSEHTFEFEWEPGMDGVTEGVEYQFRLAKPGEDLSAISWQPASGWTSDTTYLVQFLEESLNQETYTFQLQARAETSDGLLTQETPSEFSFQVDAISDKGFLFKPRTITPSADGIYTTELWLEGIASSDQVTGAEAVVVFNQNVLQVDSAWAYEDQTSLLAKGGGDLVGFSKIESGKIVLSVGVLGGQASQIQGTGRVAKLQFTIDEDALSETNDVIMLTAESKLKNANGGDITLAGTDSARVE